MAIDATEITQEMVDELKKRMNIVWKPRRPYFNTAATRDTIAHYCDGIGDMNPLYTDPEYAKKSKFRRLAALPLSFTVSIGQLKAGVCPASMPGIPATSGNSINLSSGGYIHLYQ